MVLASKVVAFALGGLGGNNAHTAGFLAAAKDNGIQPDIVSVTTGPIFWLYQYLSGEDLREHFVDAPRGLARFASMFDPVQIRKRLRTARPAIPEYWARWSTPFPPWNEKEWIDRLLPAEWLVPRWTDWHLGWFPDLFGPDLDFGRMASVFNDATIGVVFNTFEPSSGKERLCANDAARKLLKIRDNGDGPDAKYIPVTPDAIKDALWLYWYGFFEPVSPVLPWLGTRSHSRMDGAYNRQIILRELHHANVIFAVRPQNRKWLGPLPKNLLELRDLEIELWFNSSYASEIAGLERVNEMLEDAEIDGGVGLLDKYHHVEVVPIETSMNHGFLDYFVENGDVFDAVFEQADQAFRRFRLKPSKATAKSNKLEAVG